jgi:hypothetical protein
MENHNFIIKEAGKSLNEDQSGKELTFNDEKQKAF